MTEQNRLYISTTFLGEAMVKRLGFSFLLIAFVVGLASHLHAQLELDAKEIAKKSLPAVVLVVCTGSANASQGSGFFIRPGVVVTNYHVIENMNRGVVRVATGNDGSAGYFRIARIIAIDKDADLAILSSPAAKGELIPLLPLAASSYQIEVGETVYALGNPEGLVGTMSPGIVSAGLRSTRNQTTIQITAPISHGSSGGPVVNTKGEVIGVAVGTIASGQNLNFAIPISYVNALIGRSSFPDERQDRLDISSDSGSDIPRPWASQDHRVDLDARAKSANVGLSAVDFYYRGIHAYDEKRYENAIDEFSSAIKKDPTFASAYYNRGLVYGKLKLPNQAIADYSSSIQLDPSDEAAYFNRGRQYAGLNDYTRAIADFSSSIRLNPNDADAYDGRGYMYQLTKDYERAIEDYTVSITLNPRSISSYGHRGTVYGRLGNLEMFFRDFNKIVELDPQDYRGYLGRAIYFCKKGDVARAKTEESKVTALGGTVPNPCQ
jgi:S1-C subfamily serine protease/Flp pilus assembly protein TadD